MKTIINGVIVAAVVTWAGQVFGQDLKFTKIVATSESAIRLYWQSESNTLYQIQYIPDVSGSSTWQALVDNYPSHGTNTFWLDTGDYSQAPPVNHPKYDSMRFYRVVSIGTNPVQPLSISVTYPTNSQVLRGLVTVSVAAVSTNLPFITPLLYVDGQAMDSSADGTNFVINTCEWPNGPHILFATAKGQDNISAQHGTYAVNVAYGASAYVPVSFDNLISRVAFSQQFFEPSLGQTQQVTATFAANVNWTLQVLNEDSNIVRTVTGSGSSLNFNWDGTGDGGTNLSNGVYYYLITAQTNGQPLQMQGGGSSGGSPSSTSSADGPGATELFVLLPDGSGAVPLALYPPGTDTNGFIIFESSMQEVLAAGVSSASAGTPTGGGAEPAYAGPDSQTNAAPTRPPTVPVRDANGKYGVAYYDFAASRTFQAPPNGLPGLPPPRVQTEGSTGSFTFTNITEAAACATRFGARMQRGGWKEGFKKSGPDVSLRDLRKSSLGGNEVFGDVTIGLFESHGTYGTKQDFHTDANQTFETYIVSDNPADNGAPWFRLSEFGFGGSLRYVAILACNMLTDANNNYSSMSSGGVLPIPSNLHLLCSCSSTATLARNGPTICAASREGYSALADRCQSRSWMRGLEQEASPIFTWVISFQAFPFIFGLLDGRVQ